jgi:hypothetical protein
MKLKPITTHRKSPAIKPLVTAPVSREAGTTLAYQQLVTRQNLSPDRAKQLLGWPRQK